MLEHFLHEAKDLWEPKNTTFQFKNSTDELKDKALARFKFKCVKPQIILKHGTNYRDENQ